MAEPFQPKFVDLVRNYSTTVGTGDFKLGPAVNGYTGFAAACQAGDSFYYSAIGVDKPAEHEVGRGTLLDSGTISRDPIGGTKTNFTSGTKSIALIAAAEWFEAVQELRVSVTPVGQSVLSAPTAADARGALMLGSASLLDSDADAALAANSDARVPTQKAIRAYVDAQGGGSPAAVADRAALSLANTQTGMAVLKEAGREGTFVFDSSNLSAKVTADTAQGIYVAPASDTTGASGAWVRKFDGPVSPEWFGVVQGDAAGTNAEANGAAWDAMTAVLAALSVNLSNSYYRSLFDVRFGLGTFEFPTLILTSGTINISGRGSGHGTNPSSAATRLKFRDCTGIVIQSSNTSGSSTKDSVQHFAATRTHLRDLALEGNFAGTETEQHGLHARASFVANNVAIINFAGDGLRIEADTSTVGGNATDWLCVDPYIVNCRNGIYDAGDNTSAGNMVGGTINSNRQWGIWASNFLGSTWTGIELANNGVQPFNDGATGAASVVSYGGNRYGAIVGQEAAASINAPSGGASDNAYWYYMAAGAPVTGMPAWASGMLVRAGGCVVDDNVSSRNSYSGCYAETNQGKAQVCQRSMVSGGMLSTWVYQNTAASKGAAVLRGGNNGVLETDTAIYALSGAVTARLGVESGNPNNTIVRGDHASVAPSGYMLNFWSSQNALILTYGNSTATGNFPIYVSGPNTTQQFGTGAAVPHCVWMPKLALTDNALSISNARRIFVDSAAPSTGAHGQGEFAFYRGATAGRIGSICRVAGTPGAWDDLYAMTADKQAAWTAWTGTGSKATKAVTTATTADCAAAIKSLIDDLKARGVLA
jgi:hypothetical protein